ncbi:MAG: M18 family aminopeptidase, partial [Pseudomonadales bacterium]|nr:M18 family aminopeptidase [Pseudomonadales bacterium]
IHLDREVNKNRTINAQDHLPALIGAAQPAAENDFLQLLAEELPAQWQRDNDTSAPKHGIDTILDHELLLYDTQRAVVQGLRGEYIAAARLDNLLSCYIDAQALLGACADEKDQAQWSLLICSDHEEVGSQSAAGAGGPFLAQVLQRIEPDPQLLARALSRSMLISTDNAHASHPNYADKMDSNHAPIINAGPVIKVNANQRYASNSETQAVFRALCAANDIPLQNFVMRSDMACGSTIGPITATELGIKTLDVGVPTLAMHSIRELAGSRDTGLMRAALQAFYARR